MRVVIAVLMIGAVAGFGAAVLQLRRQLRTSSYPQQRDALKRASTPRSIP